MEKCEVRAHSSFEALDALMPLWQANATLPDVDSEIFKLVVQSRKEIKSPYILSVTRGGHPLAVLVGRIEEAEMPLKLGYRTLKSIPVRRLIFLEGGLIGEQSREVLEVLFVAVKRALRAQNLDFVFVENLRSDSAILEPLRECFGRFSMRPIGVPREHWLFRLPETWDSFLKSLNKKRRYWFKRLPSVLDRDFGRDWSIRRYAASHEAHEFVEVAEKVACLTYHRKLGAGFRKDLETLGRLDLEARRGGLRGYALFIQGEPRAFWCCSVYRDRLWLNSTGYHPEFRSYELGTILLLHVFENHCGGPVSEVDFGLGDADYKRRFATEHYLQQSWYLFPGTFRGFGLNLTLTALALVNQVGKQLLAKLGLMQFVKTSWRRTLTGSGLSDRSKSGANVKTDAESDEPSGQAH